MKKLGIIILSACFLIVVSLVAAPQINKVNDNRVVYVGGNVPKYEKLEVTFEVVTTAKNLQLPYDASPPPGGLFWKAVSQPRIRIFSASFT